MRFGRFYPGRFFPILVIFTIVLSPLICRGADRVAEVRFIGLKKTKPAYLHFFMTTKKGEKFDPSIVQKDIQSMRNLQIFTTVTHSVEDSPSGKIITFHLQETLTILPVLNFGGISNNLWFQAGIQDTNFLGRGYTMGGFYRYYDRNSVAGYVKAPHLFSKKWGLWLGIANYLTVEPVVYSGEDVQYKVDRFEILIFGRYNFTHRTFLEFGGSYLKEKFHLAVPSENPEIPLQDIYDKYLIKTALTVNFTDYFYHYVNGFFNECGVELVITVGYDDVFYKILNITKLFIRSGKKGNLAFRLRAGLSTNRDSAFVPFVLDSYINVRGSGNRVARGTAELTLNAEYRHTLLEKNWGGIQGVGFLDWSSWRPAAGSLAEMFDSQNTITFFGFGFRLYLRKFYHLILRIDFGMNIMDTHYAGIVIGAGQYF